jgi:hypothetical protein
MSIDPVWSRCSPQSQLLVQQLQVQELAQRQVMLQVKRQVMQLDQQRRGMPPVMLPVQQQEHRLDLQFR